MTAPSPASRVAIRQSADPVGTALGHYGHVLRTRWRAILIGGLVGLVLAGAVALVRPPTVTATAVLQVDVITTTPFALDRAASTFLDASTEQQIASSYVVALRAAEALGPEVDAREIQQASSASVEPNATIVRIRYAGSGESEARERADSVARSYLAYRGDQVATQIADQLTGIETRLDELAEVQAEALTLLADDDVDASAAAAAESDLRLAGQEIDALVRERTTLRAISTQGGRVLTPAEISDVSYSPRRSLVLATGLFAGLGLGVAIAFARHRWSRELVTLHDVAEATDAPVWRADSASHRRPSWDVAIQLIIARLGPEVRRLAVISLTPPPPTLVEHVAGLMEASNGWIAEVRMFYDNAPMSQIVRGAREADAVIIAADCGACPRLALDDLMDALDQVGRPPAGTIDVAERRGSAAEVESDQETPTPHGSVISSPVNPFERVLVSR